MLKLPLTLIAILVFICPSAFAQGKKIDKTMVPNDTTMLQLLLIKINKFRTENNLDTLDRNEILSEAAKIQSDEMAYNEKAQLENSKGKHKTTGKRLQASGGTDKAEEVVIGVSPGKGKEDPKVAAETIMAKWRTAKKESTILLNASHVYIGMAAYRDKNDKKTYVSCVLGSYNSFNDGADKRKEMEVPYTKKKKLKAPDKKICKKSDRFREYDVLVKGIYVEDEKIYLKYNNLKAFKKLMKKPTDALAIDIIQKKQYENPDYNIYDNNLVSKGVLLKQVYSTKIYKKNRAEKDQKGKVKELDVLLGKLPGKLEEPYEFNLVVIQDNCVCKTITSSYIDMGTQESNTQLDMQLDTLAFLKPEFTPRAESTILNFIVPFEKNKFDYKQEDIKPIMDALQEPDFIIDGLYISAYSSIEGDSVANAKLQNKRAESIIKAMQTMQTQKINANVKTSDTWSIFSMEMEGHEKYDYLTKMKKKDAIKEINTKGLAKELEVYFAKQRFAQVVMDITYDITGPKEIKFCTIQFNKAIKKGDYTTANRILTYIEKCIDTKKFPVEMLSGLEIPKEAKNVPLLMNNVVYRYLRNKHTVTDEDFAELKELLKLDPANSYLTFNNIFCEIKLGENYDKTFIDNTQKKIDELYKTRIPKKTVDALNIEFQFKIMEALDTIDGAEPTIAACIEKVKSFYNLKESSWQNSLKLAYEFIKFKDFKYAASLLDQFIREEKVDEKLLFTYISVCAQIPERIKSRLFVTALEKAEKANPERYCQLFGQPYLTFQVFDNPHVKADYNKSSCVKKQ